MKAIDLREKDELWLKKELESLLKAQFSMRMQKAMQQLNNNSQFKKIRRDIARIHTILTQKRRKI